MVSRGDIHNFAKKLWIKWSRILEGINQYSIFIDNFYVDLIHIKNLFKVRISRFRFNSKRPVSVSDSMTIL